MSRQSENRRAQNRPAPSRRATKNRTSGSRAAVDGAGRNRPGRAATLHPQSLLNLLRDGGGLAVLYLQPRLDRAAAWLGLRVAPWLRIISPLGWMLLAGTALLWSLGAVFGWQEALVAALLGSILMLIAVGFILGGSSYAVELDLARTRVAVGDRAVGSVAVTNTAAKTLLPAALELPVGASTALFELPRMKAGQLHEDLFTIPTQRRAVIVVGPVRSVRTDPLGLLRRQLIWTEPTDLFVHPRTTALAGSAAGFIRDLEGMPTKELSSADVSFHALRDYVPGDDRRHIHWKTTARTGELMVRQFEETRRAHLAIALSTHSEEFEQEADFELAVSTAASIGLQAIREQRNLSVMSQQGPVRTQTGRNLLDDLTRVEGRPLRITAVDLARTTAESVPNASVFFLVVGSRVGAATLRSAAAAVPPGVRCFAIRCAQGLDTGRASIGDLTVLSLGSLNDLALVLRKAAA